MGNINRLHLRFLSGAMQKEGKEWKFEGVRFQISKEKQINLKANMFPIYLSMIESEVNQ